MSNRVLVGHREYGSNNRGEQRMQGRNTKPVLTMCQAREMDEIRDKITRFKKDIRDQHGLADIFDFSCLFPAKLDVPSSVQVRSGLTIRVQRLTGRLILLDNRAQNLTGTKSLPVRQPDDSLPVHFAKCDLLMCITVNLLQANPQQNCLAA